MKKKSRLSRREVRSLNQQGVVELETAKFTRKFTPKSVIPKTEAQHEVFESYNNGRNLFLIGSAGTGKTYVPIYLAMRDVLEERFRRLVIVRSAVPTREIGHLPGSIEEKVSIYEAPYQQVCADLFGRKDAYEILKKQCKIDFVPTSFVRGTNINNSIVVLDEAQNMTEHEISSVMTRLGPGSRIIVCGDLRQNDLTKEKTGFNRILAIVERMKSVDIVQFTTDDIVRSGFVKEFIIASEEVDDESVQQKSSYSTSRRESHDRWNAAL